MPATRLMRYIGCASRRRAVVDPGLEALDVLGWPGLVARHAALGDPLVDVLGVLPYCLVGREIEGERHRFDVGVAEERADVAPEGDRVLCHAVLLSRRGTVGEASFPA